MSRRTWLVALFLLASPDAPARAGEGLTFEANIRPILKAYCFECHGEGEKLKGELDLRLRRTLAKGGKSGAAVVRGQPEESLLYQYVRDEEMPPGKKKLDAGQIALIGRWIAAGAETARPEPEQIDAGFQITESDRAFWAFQPVRRPAVPELSDPDRLLVRTPIDAFLLAEQKKHGLTFSPEADRLTLLRRASFDLTGLPPSPEDAARFLADTTPDAYDRLIDGLLASPHYGERWGRHWLDVAGYADSDGYTGDRVRLHAYKYRDYVIRSFNADTPFDQMIEEQMAGDERLTPPYRNLSPAEREMLTATGFLRMAADGTAVAGTEPIQARNQVIADTIKIVSTSLLGPDPRLRPVPRPSLRPDSPDRLLSLPGTLRAGLRHEQVAHL